MYMSKKFDLAIFVALAEEHGGKCLSTEYVDNKTPLSWRCAEGHEWQSAPQNVRPGKWCPECSKSSIRGHPIEVDGKLYPSIKSAAHAYGLDIGCVTYRISSGWSISDAFGITQREGARTGREISVGGRSFSSFADVARHYGLTGALLKGRLKDGWSLEQAVGLAIRKRRSPSKGRQVTVGNQQFPSISEAADHYGIDVPLAGSRIRAGWTAEQALGVEPPPKRKRNYANFEEIAGKLYPRTNAGTYKLYLVTSRIDGKEYVGITMGTIEKRWGEHLSMGARAIDTKLKRAIRKHGIENFTIELLRADATNYRELMTQEIEEIARRQAYERGYNSTRGGEIVFNAREIVVGDLIFPTLSSAAEHFEVDEALIRARIDAMGWSIEQAVGLVERPKTKYAPKGQIEIAGQTFESQKAVAVHFEIGFQRYSLRVTRYGWTPEQALGLEPPPNGSSGVSVAVTLKDGQRFKSLSAAASHFGMHQGIAAHRRSIGWTLEQALGIEPKPKRRPRTDLGFSVVGRDFTSQKAAAEFYGVDYKRYNALVNQRGWTPTQALGIDPSPELDKPKIEVDALIFDSVAEAAAHFGLPRQVVYYRLKLGWDVVRALKTPKRGSRGDQST